MITLSRANAESGGPTPERARNAALDGLRGLAVTAVLVFHLFPDALPGGFLGVSVFFTLSGYLITSLLVRERVTSGTIHLGQFWARRFRRILPAALAALATVTLVWALVPGWMTQAISRDILASLAYVANWHFLVSGHAYGSNIDASPVLNFWSLAIEEQYYLVFPVVVLIALRWGRRALTATLLVALGLSCLYIGRHAGNASVIYYSTFSRGAELLIGALAALVVPVGLWRSARARRALPGAGAAAIAALALACRLTTLGTEAYYQGGFIVIALLSAVAVLSITRTSPLSRALSLAPLVWVGSLSYALYLYHWPLLIGLQSAGLRGPALALTTAGLTFALSVASLRLLELPVRLGRWPDVRLTGLGLATALFTAVVAVAAGKTASAPLIDLAQAARIANARPVPTTAPAPPPVPIPVVAGGVPATTAPPPPPPLKVALFGDSTALTLGAGMVAADPRLQVVPGYEKPGCSVGRGGYRRGDQRTGNDPKSPPYRVDGFCDWTNAWPDAVKADGGLDVAIVYSGAWDVVGRKVPALGDTWRTIGDPAYDQWLLSEMAAATDALHHAGAKKVVWLTYSGNINWHLPHAQSEYNGLIYLVQRSRPGMAVDVDLAAWLTDTHLERKFHPDGDHFTFKPNGGTAAVAVHDWLGDQLVEAAQLPKTRLS